MFRCRVSHQNSNQFTDRRSSVIEKTNQDTYKNSERQPVEDYQMTMPINRIPNFEDANAKRVSVFGQLFVK